MRLSPAEVILRGRTVITAHSGCENTSPNSREHIAEAIKSDAEMIEVDVRRSIFSGIGSSRVACWEWPGGRISDWL